MKDFAGRIAVVTGGGSGMGRELVRQLVAEACNVAMCDVSEAGMAETRRLCEAAGLPQGLRVTTHIADVSDAAQVQRFRDEVAERHDTDKIHLLFNNAGIGGGGSMIAHSPRGVGKDVQRVLGRRLSLHPRLSADAAKRRGGPHRQHQQRQRLLGVGRAAHPAHRLQCCEVRGKGLHRGADHRSADQRTPHQMLGRDAGSHRHLDPVNSRKIQSGNQSDAMDATQIAQARARIASMGRDVSGLSDDDIRNMVAERERRFREEAPTSAAQAATIILDGVKADRWRILVGDDAHRIDERVRRSPEQAYELDFFESFAREVGWRLP